ncbi:signal peptide peptidase SppA [Caviibacterium pharyngocola]|uniref:Signal peptide peptidase SppA n=1 Tax=Caviibacterium pharyngocola TaxID=28159 RepID=A0A2M8RUY6_9PAST|nr:signal peptide peptidase SppA [Caviibacterium pharyngocola]PJG82716.1 signal peptide peptidase SppA [Caviibacterium pharyngocola]
MQPIIRLIKFFWCILNFIRDAVMNLVFLFFVLLLTVIVGLVMNFHSKESVNLTGDQGALLLNLDGYLTDNRENALSWRNTLKELDNQYVPRQISTFDVVYAIFSAAQDERIKGLVLDLNRFEGADLPALNYIGKTIQEFKTSGKPVIAYADNYTQQQYLLASYADEIYLNPIGQVSIEGMAVENLYFKTLLDKLEVTPHIFRVGTYKSAVEPFLRDDMSPEAKANAQRWLSEMWQSYKATIATNRDIKNDDVLPKASRYLAELKGLNGDVTAYVKQRRLVTQTADRFTLDQKLTALFGKNENDEAKLLEFDTYLAALPDRMSAESAHKIAVVNVEGAIIDGESEEESVGGDSVAALLRQAYLDDDILAVILRVNSPGGSAFASEVIRQEIDHLQQKGKPVVVSMGAMAASGGYWIASTADYIIADPNTVTGSIGIFALFPTFEKSIKKIGVSADGVSTTELTMSQLSALPKTQGEILQLEIENGYDRFLSLVSKGRGLSKAQADEVAQGQIWLGSEAYRHKLVDELGDFDTAVNKAGELVNQKREDSQKISDFSLEWLTEEDDSLLGSLMRDFKQSSRTELKTAVAELFGLPNALTKTDNPLGLLNRFNDPKGQYLYCVNCGKVR